MPPAKFSWLNTFQITLNGSKNSDSDLDIFMLEFPIPTRSSESKILDLMNKPPASFFIFHSLSRLDLVNRIDLVNKRGLITTFTKSSPSCILKVLYWLLLIYRNMLVADIKKGLETSVLICQQRCK